MTYISQKWLDVLVPFTENYNQRMTGSTIAKKVHIPQKTVSRILHALSPTIIRYNRDGKNKYYYFDLNDKKSHIVLSMVEHTKALRTMTKYPHFGLMFAELMWHSTVVLFGSYAKGTEHKESDVDLWIVGRKNKNIQRIIEKYPYEVHVQFSTLNEFQHKLEHKHNLALEIASHHVIFGNADEIVDGLMRYW